MQERLMNQTTSPPSSEINPGSERILDAAESLFAEHGFNGVSIQQVANKSGISKATVFHHFANKQELYISVVRRACEGTMRLLQSLSSDAQGDALKQLGDYRQRDLSEIQAHASVVRLILRELTMGNESQAKQLVDDVFGEHFLRLKNLITRAQSHGQIRPDMDAGIQAHAIVSINIMLFLLWPVLHHLPDTPFSDIEHASRQTFRMLLEGIQTPAPSEKTIA